MEITGVTISSTECLFLFLTLFFLLGFQLRSADRRNNKVGMNLLIFIIFCTISICTALCPEVSESLSLYNNCIVHNLYYSEVGFYFYCSTLT